MRVTEGLHLVDWLSFEEVPDVSQLRDTWVSLHGNEVGSDSLWYIKCGILEELRNDLATELITHHKATHGLNGSLGDVSWDLLVLCAADQDRRYSLREDESQLVVSLNRLTNVSDGLYE